MPWGCVSGERLAERALIVASPPDPHYGSESLRIFHIFRRAKSRFVSLLFSAHRGLLPSKFNHFSSNAHRLMPTYLFGAAVIAHPVAAQLPRLCQGRRYSHNADASKFPRCRGLCPRGEKDQPHYWGPRRSPAKRVRWGEEEQGSGMTDAHTWASGIKRTLRRRCPPYKTSHPSGGRPS